MNRHLPILLVASLAVPTLGAAQQAPERQFDAARYVAAPALSDLVEAAPLARATVVPMSAREAAGPQSHAVERRKRSFVGTVLHTLGGAVVGGWVGFVGSQVALSDWEKETNGSFSSERRAWVAGGMLVGILGSRLVGTTSNPGAPGVEMRRPRSERNVLTREQIESSGATSVYELVLSMRKEWLVPRGVNSFQESARGSGSGMGPGAQMNVQAGQPTVVVYMDANRIGEVDRMREIMINDIMEIEFIEPQAAVYRYGSGHAHGVILLKTSTR